MEIFVLSSFIGKKIYSVLYILYFLITFSITVSVSTAVVSAFFKSGFSFNIWIFFIYIEDLDDFSAIGVLNIFICDVVFLYHCLRLIDDWKKNLLAEQFYQRVLEPEQEKVRLMSHVRSGTESTKPHTQVLCTGQRLRNSVLQSSL